MIRSILSWSTALLVLCSGLLASCDDKDEEYNLVSKNARTGIHQN